MSEFRRILLDGQSAVVTREGERLHAKDGRSVAVEDAVHLPATDPRKIICVHLNYLSRVDEFMTKLPATSTCFHKPLSALCGHRARAARARLDTLREPSRRLTRPALRAAGPSRICRVSRSPALRYRDTMAYPNRMGDKCRMDGYQFLERWWFA